MIEQTAKGEIMKKVWKGVAASISALALAATGFIGADTAFADDSDDSGSTTADSTTTTGNIVLNNTVSGDVFDAYQILTATSSGDAVAYNFVDGYNSATTTALVKAINDTNGNTAITSPGANATTNQINTFRSEIISAIDAFKATDDNAGKMREFAQNLYKELQAQSPAVEPVATATASGTSTTMAVAPGFYLVNQTSQAKTGDTTNNTTSTLTQYIVNTVTAGNNTEVDLKKGTVTLTKKVMDKNDSDATTSTAADTDTSDVTSSNGWTDSADYDQGDEVPFKLTGTLPENYANYNTFQYKFSDTLSKGLAGPNNVQVYAVNGSTATLIPSKWYTLDPETASDGSDASTFTISFDNLKTAMTEEDGTAITINANTSIVVRYSATLTGDATRGEAGNPNTAYVQFSNSPNLENGGELNNTPVDKVTVFTYTYGITKTFVGADAPAANDMPVFQLSKLVNGTWTPVETATVAAVPDTNPVQYKANFTKSIDDGKYMVEETKTPAGFNKANNVYFEVTATHDDPSNDPQLKTLTITYYETDAFKTPISQGEDENKNPIYNVNGDLSSGALNTDIVNTAGTKLPSTGGMGTTMLYIAGAAIVLIAGIGLAVAIRRRNA